MLLSLLNNFNYLILVSKIRLISLKMKSIFLNQSSKVSIKYRMEGCGVVGDETVLSSVLRSPPMQAGSKPRTP